MDLLIRLLLGTRWVLVFLIVVVPITALGAPLFPIRIGGDGPDDDALNIHVGAVFDEGMNEPAVFVQTIVAVIVFAFAIYAIGQMLGVLRNVRAGNSFVRDNGTRLRRIGFGGIAAQLSIYAVWIAALVIEAAGAVRFDGLTIELNFAPWIGVLMAFALAAVFRDGAELKEEQDLTV